MFENWLLALGKLEYAQGKKRPQVDCILCAIRDDDEKVVSLKVYQDDLAFVVLNIYPYNPAHIMAAPIRHVTQFTDLKKDEVIHLFRTIQGLQLMLNDIYSPHGYNIGINQGKNAGASIDHLHIHLVPRYGSELGFIDIIGNSRVTPLTLTNVKEKIEDKINEYLNDEFFKSFK